MRKQKRRDVADEIDAGYALLVRHLGQRRQARLEVIETHLQRRQLGALARRRA